MDSLALVAYIGLPILGLTVLVAGVSLIIGMIRDNIKFKRNKEQN